MRKILCVLFSVLNPFQTWAGDVDYWEDGSIRSIAGQAVDYWGDGTIRSVGGRPVYYWGNGTIRSIGDQAVDY